MGYLIVLRYAPRRGEDWWNVFCFHGKQKLFRLSFKKEQVAVYLAAKLVDELKRNGHKCRWQVQDETGRCTGQDLIAAGRKMNVRGE
jgi:hypothetical protein